MLPAEKVCKHVGKLVEVVRIIGTTRPALFKVRYWAADDRRWYEEAQHATYDEARARARKRKIAMALKFLDMSWDDWYSHSGARSKSDSYWVTDVCKTVAAYRRAKEAAWTRVSQ